LLYDGIRALEGGDRERGLELLLQVVERDNRIEQAWWWLSLAAEQIEDQITALENVLDLNPNHTQARQRLADLQERKAQPEWKSLLPEAPLEEPDADLDNQYQCPYCAYVTTEQARHCPRCGRGLWRRTSKSTGSGMFRLMQLVASIVLAFGIVDTLTPLFAIGAARGSAGPGLEAVGDIPGVKEFLGDFLAMNLKTANWLLTAQLTRLGGLFILLVGLSARWAIAYYLTAIALIADLGWNLYLLFSGYLGVLGVGVNLFADLGWLLLLFACTYEFPINDERILVKPDGVARSANDYFMLGHRYQKHGLWALAVAQWRRAVGLAPTVAGYYKDLAIGYAQLNRFTRSTRALNEARHLEPDNKGLDEILELVKARQAAYQQARKAELAKAKPEAKPNK
jgi:tetratricopeptide (TPR) repeat protein